MRSLAHTGTWRLQKDHWEMVALEEVACDTKSFKGIHDDMGTCMRSVCPEIETAGVQAPAVSTIIHLLGRNTLNLFTGEQGQGSSP